MSNRTDEQLALGVQQGRKEDLAVLVERHYPALLNYLYRLSAGHQALAEDMSQETFYRILRSIHSYQYPRPFLAWMYSIATHSLRNHYAKADTRYADNYDEQHAEDWHSTEASPEAQALAYEQSQAVLKALEQVPLHQREVIVLFYYQELPQQSIAESLNIPIGTVKSRLSIGLRRLRQLLDENLPSPASKAPYHEH